MKKRGLVLVFVMLVSIGLAGAFLPPSFQVFNGNVFCTQGIPETSYDIVLNINNGTNSTTQSQSVVDSVYSFVVSADETYSISFYVEGILINETNYVPYAITEINLTLALDNPLCVSPSGEGEAEAEGEGEAEAEGEGEAEDEIEYPATPIFIVWIIGTVFAIVLAIFGWLAYHRFRGKNKEVSRIAKGIKLK